MKVLPGSTLGMLGGGQLGRMFTIAARTMGYEVVVLDPDKESPAGKLATRHLCADYSDQAALEQIASDELPSYIREHWQSDLNHRLGRLQRKANRKSP